MHRMLWPLGVLLALTMTVVACGSPTNTTKPTPTPTQQPFANPADVMDALLRLEAVLQEVHQNVGPSVVNIRSIRGDGIVGQGRTGTGSGFVWDTDGHIVTNDHVIADATHVTVTFPDGPSVQATVVGQDPDSDLAVLRVDVSSEWLRPVELADFSQVHVGQLAVAIGNPFGLDGTMTQGIVSALGRMLPVRPGDTGAGFYSIPDVVQTDASINPGNSGGVLVDINGRLFGVPSAIIAEGTGNTGIGFAIPSAIVEQVVPVLISNGSYEHPWLGVQVISMSTALAQAMGLPSGQRGALVTQVTPGSPAESGGVRGGPEREFVDGMELEIGGDIIIGIDDQEVRNTDNLIAYQARHTRPGQTVDLRILRNGEEQTLQITMGTRP